MARSFAILLMLEGHFTGATLGNEYRDYQYPLYKFWHLLHGLTSPLFFTVTGLIFVYLLIGKENIPFNQNIRVRKGIKRISQLIFWGYFIQLNLWTIGKSIYYGTQFYLDWFFAFHVLQSIGFGLAIVILIYRIYRWINKGPIYLYYLIGGATMFVFYGMMKAYIIADEKMIAEGLQQTRNYWPHGAPAVIQNMFYGPYSDFSFVRMSGYTILGGALGALIKINEHNVRKLWFCITVILSGLLLAIMAKPILIHIDTFIEWIGLTENGTLWYNATSISRFGQVVVLIGILMLVDKYIDVKAPLFLKIGQTTFPVYVVHVIILYGGIFGFGLKPYVFDRNLSPYAAIAISATAIAFFAVMVKYIEPLEKIYDSVLIFLRIKKRKQD